MGRERRLVTSMFQVAAIRIKEEGSL